MNKLTEEERHRLALEDAEDESWETLQAGAQILERLRKLQEKKGDDDGSQG